MILLFVLALQQVNFTSLGSHTSQKRNSPSVRRGRAPRGPPAAAAAAADCGGRAVAWPPAGAGAGGRGTDAGAFGRDGGRTPRGGEDGRTRPRGGGWVSRRRGDGGGRWGRWLSVATKVIASRFCVRARSAPRLPGVPRWRLAVVRPGEGGSGPRGRGVCRGGRAVQGRARECCCVTARAAGWASGGSADRRHAGCGVWLPCAARHVVRRVVCCVRAWTTMPCADSAVTADAALASAAAAATATPSLGSGGGTV